MWGGVGWWWGSHNTGLKMTAQMKVISDAWKALDEEGRKVIRRGGVALNDRELGEGEGGA